METNLLHRLAQEVLFMAQQRHTPATQIQHFLRTYSRFQPSEVQILDPPLAGAVSVGGTAPTRGGTFQSPPF
jgi:hypothetical protein